MKKSKIAIFDIDGTIFRSSLLIELTEALIEEGVFLEEIRKVYLKSYNKWADRKDSYEKYINSLVVAFESNIKGVNHREFIKIARQVINTNKNRVYCYTRDLVKELKKKNYYLLVISNSPKEIVRGFCESLGFDKVYGRTYEVINDKFTGKTLFLDLISDKAKILKRVLEKENLTLSGSIGVGDSESDIAFLNLVEKPICFNPNGKLYKHAKRAGWQVIVERKDVVYKL